MAFLAVLLALAAAADDTLILPREKVILFNGKDLAGWHSWLVDSRRDDPRRVFAVEEGQLRISGDGFGYLSTERAYRDYKLEVEFRWGNRNWRGRENKARDSGIFLHSAGPEGNSFDGGGAFKAAIECQIMEGSVGDLLLIKGKDERGRQIPLRLSAEIAPRRDADGWAWWKRGGERTTFERTGRVNWFGKDPNWSDTFGFRGAADAEHKAGLWNHMAVVCRGPTISIRVNGTLVNEAFDVYPAEGPILLQCEGSEIFFRKVELHPLAEQP